ncbi:MAG TPA: DNA-3-methyladenine glycosylase 2 family protein [Burkholderiales bacterium]|jgi:DNA-3-methyladenine glycosylase II|nr:DNA-3-methyladenine glycosylase 2 family protein [Burkholderiales bacterium]
MASEIAVLRMPDYWMRAARDLAERDPILDCVIHAHPDVMLRSRGDPFQTLARSIVGQQISLKAADSVWARVCALSAIEPRALLKQGVVALAGCGLSQRKAEYIHDLARHFDTGAIKSQRWDAMDDEAIIAELVEVRGIGRWTAEMFLIFNLLRPDVLPVDDLGLQRAVSELYFCGEAVGAAGVRHVASIWSPWRSVATWYLWRSLDPVPVEY